jgi:hypothetical protein
MNYDGVLKAFMAGAGFSLLTALMQGASTWVFGSGVYLDDKVNEWIGGGSA